MMCICPEFKIPRELVDPQIALLLFWAMAAEAVRLQKGIKRFRRVNGTGQD